jgi:hypothetical protein
VWQVEMMDLLLARQKPPLSGSGSEVVLSECCKLKVRTCTSQHGRVTCMKKWV